MLITTIIIIIVIILSLSLYIYIGHAAAPCGLDRRGGARGANHGMLDDVCFITTVTVMQPSKLCYFLHACVYIYIYIYICV